MPAAKFKCKRCKRSFSMAAHLARHMKAIHGPKKKTTRAKTTKRESAGVVGSEGIIHVMEAHHSDLLAQRTSLDAQIDAIARAMKAIGATSPTKRKPQVGKKKGRPVAAVARKGTLKDHIVRVLRKSSKPLSLEDIGTRVIKAGFKTKTKDIKRAVSNTIQDLKMVKRPSRGKYQMAK